MFDVLATSDLRSFALAGEVGRLYREKTWLQSLRVGTGPLFHPRELHRFVDEVEAILRDHYQERVFVGRCRI